MIAFADSLCGGGARHAGGRDVTRADRREGTEPVGPIAGDGVTATFGFAGRWRRFFQSWAGMHRPGFSLYGLRSSARRRPYGLRSPGDVFVYPAPVPQPEDTKAAWQKVWVEDWHFTPEHKPRPMNDSELSRQSHPRSGSGYRDRKQEPAAGESCRMVPRVTEMIQGVYASHLAGGTRLEVPLKQRKHPLT